jgi:hypothetical protein
VVGERNVRIVPDVSVSDGHGGGEGLVAALLGSLMRERTGGGAASANLGGGRPVGPPGGLGAGSTGGPGGAPTMGGTTFGTTARLDGDVSSDRAGRTT